MIDFFSLPKDILIHIYEYDPTYNEIYDKVIRSINRTNVMREYLENKKKRQKKEDVIMNLHDIKHRNTFSSYIYDYPMYLGTYYEIHDNIKSIVDSHELYSYYRKERRFRTDEYLYEYIKEVRNIREYENKWIYISSSQ